MVVHSGDDRVVMAIPRHHGDFGFEVAFLFARWLNSEQEKRWIQLEQDCTLQLLNSLVSPLIILHLALANKRPAGSFTGAIATQGMGQTKHQPRKEVGLRQL